MKTPEQIAQETFVKMTTDYKEIGTIDVTGQGSFAPERLASEVWSRRFAKLESGGRYTVVTIEAAAVIDEYHEGEYYPESITEVCTGEADPEYLDGDYSECDYNSDLSPTNFTVPEEAAAEAQRFIKSLSAEWI